MLTEITRLVLRLDRQLAPVKVAVLPLSRNADLTPKARDVAAVLRRHWNVDFDDAAVLVAVFAAAGGYASAQTFSDGFAAALAVAAGVALAGAIAGAALPRTPAGQPARARGAQPTRRERLSQS